MRQIKYGPIIAIILAGYWLFCTLKPTFSSPLSQAIAPMPGVTFYSWSQYDSFPTIMTPVNNSICVLQSLTGKFKGGGESVWIKAVDGYWVLGGESRQQDVAAKAMCVEFQLLLGDPANFLSVYQRSVSVTKGQGCSWNEACPRGTTGIAKFALARPTFCFLTGIGGHLYGEGESAWVGFDRDYQLATLRIQTAIGFISGAAACLLDANGAIPTSKQYSWHQGQPPVALFYGDEALCAINFISGRFEGHSERVEIYTDENNIQWLGGTSRQNGVKVGAICILYAPIPEATPTPSPTATPAPTATPEVVKQWNIVSKATGQCVDVAGFSLESSATIHTWECLGAHQLNQVWRLESRPSYHEAYAIVAQHSQLCLDVAGYSTQDAAFIQQYLCLNRPNQLWRLRPVGDAFQIISVHSEMCLSLPINSTVNGLPVQQWRCSSEEQTTQLWYLREVQ